MILLKRYQLIATDSVQAPKIYSIGFSDDPRVTRFGPSVRNQYIIHYVLSGKGSFNGNKVEKEQGFLIVPGMYEEYHSDESDPWSFLWIIFSRGIAQTKKQVFSSFIICMSLILSQSSLCLPQTVFHQWRGFRSFFCIFSTPASRQKANRKNR